MNTCARGLLYRDEEKGSNRLDAPGQTAAPEERFTQVEILTWTGYTDSIRQGFFLNSGIDSRRFLLDRETFTVEETVDQLDGRFERGSLKLGCQAILACLAPRQPQNVGRTS